MKDFDIEYVDDRNTIVHLPTDAIPLDMQHEAVAALNEEHGFEHWGDHEERITFGLLCSTGDDGVEISICAMLDGAFSCVHLRTT